MKPHLLWMLALLASADAATPAEQAETNGRQGAAALAQSRRVMQAWLNRVDPVTGLLPRTGKDPNWVVKDSAADLYPFLVIGARYLEPGLYSGVLRSVLHQEMLLSRRLGRLSDDVQPNGKGFVHDKPEINRIIFGSSEYAKDGLLPLTELLGASPWRDRLLGIAEDILRQSPYESPRGKLPAQTSEVNGNMLQVWSRLAWAGREDFLEAALRVADYYLLDMLPSTGYLPADQWDAASGKPLRPVFVLSDHGNEIVGGLSEVVLLAETKRPEKARQYREPFLRMIERLLETGRNADRVWVSRLDLATGKVLDGRHAHCWGYMFNGVYTAYLISGEAKYRRAVEEAIGGVTEHQKYLFDETGAGRNWGSNAYSDSIEGALVLLNRLPSASFAAAIDQATEKFLARVRGDGIVEDWYGDGNFIRTAMMYALWKSGGAWLDPWPAWVKLGAADEAGVLTVSIATAQPWRGRVHFDQPRHRKHWGMARNYPRLNEWPEWFTVESDRRYRVKAGELAEEVRFGWELAEGVPLHAMPGKPLLVTIKAEEE